MIRNEKITIGATETECLDDIVTCRYFNITVAPNNGVIETEGVCPVNHALWLA